MLTFLWHHKNLPWRIVMCVWLVMELLSIVHWGFQKHFLQNFSDLLKNSSSFYCCIDVRMLLLWEYPGWERTWWPFMFDINLRLHKIDFHATLASREGSVLYRTLTQKFKFQLNFLAHSSSSPSIIFSNLRLWKMSRSLSASPLYFLCLKL